MEHGGDEEPARPEPGCYVDSVLKHDPTSDSISEILDQSYPRGSHRARSTFARMPLPAWQVSAGLPRGWIKVDNASKCRCKRGHDGRPAKEQRERGSPPKTCARMVQGDIWHSHARTQRGNADRVPKRHLRWCATTANTETRRAADTILSRAGRAAVTAKTRSYEGTSKNRRERPFWEDRGSTGRQGTRRSRAVAVPRRLYQV